MLEVKVERCAGIDVGKKVLAVCIMIGLAHQKPTVEVRRFGTNVMELERLGVWLKEMGCTEGGDGEHRFLLETGIKRFGRNCEDHLGESDARQGVERQENRFQG